MARRILRTTVIIGIQLGLMTATMATTGAGVQSVRLPITVDAINHQSVVVVAGDHLWKISSRHLRNDAPKDSDVAAYWLAVIDLNRNDLRSGNPDLIFPGEVISLPPRFSANR